MVGYQGNKKCFRDNDGHVIGENVKKVIDVSQYNGHIDWSKVSKTDVDGVIIRIVSHKGGYYHIDEQFENNLNVVENIIFLLESIFMIIQIM